MAHLIKVKGIEPIIDESCWLAHDAVITGDVVVEENSSIWFGVVIRGDVNKIRIGKNCNIQDGTVVHGTIGRGDTILKDRVSIGHRAIIHGCQIESDVLIGMGAIILDDIIIPSHTIIAAGALVTSGAKLESGFIYAGTPAKKLKPIDDYNAQMYITRTSEAYVKYKEWYKNP